DSVQTIELQRRRLGRQHRKRKTLAQAVHTRLALETLRELTRHLLLDLPMPVEKLPPQGHVPKSMVDHASGGQVRRREQTTIRVEVVQPRGPNHLLRLAQGSFHMLEEGGQVRQSLTAAFDPERGTPIRLGISKVEAN